MIIKQCFCVCVCVYNWNMLWQVCRNTHGNQKTPKLHTLNNKNSKTKIFQYSAVCMAVVSQRNSSLQRHWHRDAQENMIRHVTLRTILKEVITVSFSITERHYLGSEIENLTRESVFSPLIHEVFPTHIRRAWRERGRERQIGRGRESTPSVWDRERERERDVIW